MPDTCRHKDQEPDSDMAAVFAALGDDRRLVIVFNLQDRSNRSISEPTAIGARIGAAEETHRAFGPAILSHGRIVL